MRPVVLRDKDLSVLCAMFRRFPAVREVRVFGSRATDHARVLPISTLPSLRRRRPPANGLIFATRSKTRHSFTNSISCARNERPANGSRKKSVPKE